MKYIVVFLCLLFFSCSDKEQLKHEDFINISLLSTRGLQGYLYPHDYLTDKPLENGSLWELEPAIRVLQENSNRLILFDLGNSIWGNQINLLPKIYANPMVTYFNHLDYDILFPSRSDMYTNVDERLRHFFSFDKNVVSSNLKDIIPTKNMKDLLPSLRMQIEGGIEVLFFSYIENQEMNSYYRSYDLGRIQQDLKRNLQLQTKPYDLVVLLLNAEMKNKRSQLTRLLEETLPQPSIVYLYPSTQNRLIQTDGILFVEQVDSYDSLNVLNLQLTQSNGQWKILGSDLNAHRANAKREENWQDNTWMKSFDKDMKTLLSEKLNPDFQFDNDLARSSSGSQFSNLIAQALTLFTQTDFVIVPKMDNASIPFSEFTLSELIPLNKPENEVVLVDLNQIQLRAIERFIKQINFVVNSNNYILLSKKYSWFNSVAEIAETRQSFSTAMTRGFYKELLDNDIITSNISISLPENENNNLLLMTESYMRYYQEIME